MIHQNHPLDSLKTQNRYPKGLRVSDDQLAAVNIFPHDFHGEWNYTIAPIRNQPKR